MVTLHGLHGLFPFAPVVLNIPSIMSSGESGVVRGSGDSVKQAIIEELQNLLSSDTVVLQQAEKRNKQLQYTEGYGVYLAEIIMNQSHELPLRQIALDRSR
ncbi:importin-9-like [Drosophila albomicans]|uniref:Importin-9-like n=1 Tax=Drosophila albomicans TaxID=7291 RepID=A0A9C6T0L4_DROAB|nr:importin-9-like [Drosophila albomicans]